MDDRLEPSGRLVVPEPRRRLEDAMTRQEPRGFHEAVPVPTAPREITLHRAGKE